jgi:hypothetical protein
MTFDGTNVAPEELTTFGKGARDRADRTTTAGDAVGRVHLGSDMLGLFSIPFLSSAREGQQEIVSKVRSLAAALTDDGAIAIANARDFEDTNTAQASQFKNMESQ